MSMITILVAFDDNQVIGNKGELPWHIPEDLALFKKRTLGHPVIMGRKTWDSLPKRPLTKRINIVISNGFVEIPGGHLTAKSPIRVETNLGSALEAARTCRPLYGTGIIGYPHEIFIIGGRMVYETALRKGWVDRILVSNVHGTHEGDLHFPTIKWWRWKKKVLEVHEKFNVVEYRKRWKL